jgi:hypothetical protein
MGDWPRRRRALTQGEVVNGRGASAAPAGDTVTRAGGGGAGANVPDGFGRGDASRGELDSSLRGASGGGRAGVLLSLMHRSSSERSCSTDRRDLVRRGSSATGEASMQTACGLREGEQCV